jgi:hypothetical protein
MKFQDNRRMAKGMDINTYRMKKTDLLHAIERKENNTECYGTNRVDYCEEAGSLWRTDRVPWNNLGKAK